MNYAYNYLPTGSARYTGVADAHARFIMEKQLKDKALWERFVQVFVERPDFRDYGWRGEYYGKMMRGACLTYRYAPDEELYDILYKTVSDLLDTQDELGRIASYPVSHEFAGWDIWSRKYVIVGSLYFYGICRDEQFKARILDCMEKHVDYLIAHIGAEQGKMSILDTSTAWAGLNSSTILEPVIELYKLTGKQRFLDFAKYVLDQGGCHGGNLLELAEADEIYPYQYPQVKAYEMMSYFEGALAWYEVTDEVRYLDIVEKFVHAVSVSDVTIIGCSGCTHELFDHSALAQTEPAKDRGIMQETCVTVTWMRLCERLLRLTGKVEYAEHIERSAYNALYGSLNPFNQTQYSFEDKTYVAGVPFDSYSPLVYQPRGIGIGGYKKFSSGGYYGCCACIGAAGTALFPLIGVLAYEGGFAFNGYHGGVVSATTPAGNAATFTLSGDFEGEGEVKIKVGLASPERFAIKLRVPAWSNDPVLTLCAQQLPVKPGYTEMHHTWQDGDEITLSLHPEVKRVTLNGKQAFEYGCLVLARDERKENADINEPFAPAVNDGRLVLNQIDTEPGEMVRFVMDTDKGQVLLTDYAWCGKHWNEQRSAIAVWLPMEKGEINMRILMIGNSYTYFSDMPRILSALLTENGVENSVDSVTVGGRRLLENLDPADESHKRIKALCAQGGYDAAVLQEQSYFALVDYEKFLAGVRGCAEMVGAKRTVLYATWGRKTGSELLKLHGWTSGGMTAALADAYGRAAAEIGAECAHIGRCFAAIGAAHPEIELYDPDLSHPSYTGSCVAALALYKTMVGTLPTGTQCLQLDGQTALQLKAQIDKTL